METNKKALVVEDDTNIAELLRLYLEKDGFDVLLAHDGAKGVELALGEKPDIMLLDIMLPENPAGRSAARCGRPPVCP